MMKKEKLKYLFSVLYEDGTKYKQNSQDKSLLDPARSSFYDVLNSGKKIIRFSISNVWNTWAVDLLTGLFSYNGVKFIASPEQSFPEIPEFRLIYFREVQRDTTATMKDGQIIDIGEETGHRIKYFIGWQCTVNGKNYQQLIGIN